MKELKINHIYQGHSLEVLKNIPSNSVDSVITSPPYYALRNYKTNPVEWPDGWVGELGQEPHFNMYIAHLICIFKEVKRVLKDEGILFVNISDSFNGTGSKGSYRDSKYKEGRNGQEVSKNNLKDYPKKSLIQIPQRFAIRMVDELGFLLRNDIIWEKPNCLPESVKDRFTRSHEYLYFFTKNKKYYFNQILEPYESKKQKPIDKSKQNCNNGMGGINRFSEGDRDYYNKGGRNKRTVWSINTQPRKNNHFAQFPDKLVEPMILSGCPENGIVLDPFMGGGTVAANAIKHNRRYVGIELNNEFIKIAEESISNEVDKRRN